MIAMQWGENSAYKHSDIVVSLLPNAKQYMVNHGMSEEKFVCIPNGIVLEDWKKNLNYLKITRKYYWNAERQINLLLDILVDML